MSKQIPDFAPLIKEIIRHMVDDEKALELTSKVLSDGNSTLFYIGVAKSDLGRIIGKSGKTIQALEHIMSRWSGKYRLRLLLELDKKEDVK